LIYRGSSKARIRNLSPRARLGSHDRPDIDVVSETFLPSGNGVEDVAATLPGEGWQRDYKVKHFTARVEPPLDDLSTDAASVGVSSYSALTSALVSMGDAISGEPSGSAIVLSAMPN
jgi:hypothetical protein